MATGSAGLIQPCSVFLGQVDIDIAFVRFFELEPSSEVVLSGASGWARAQVPASSQQPAAMARSWEVRCDVPPLEGIDNLLAHPPARPNRWTAYRSCEPTRWARPEPDLPFLKGEGMATLGSLVHPSRHSLSSRNRTWWLPATWARSIPRGCASAAHPLRIRCASAAHPLRIRYACGGWGTCTCTLVLVRCGGLPPSYLSEIRGVGVRAGDRLEHTGEGSRGRYVPCNDVCVPSSRLVGGAAALRASVLRLLLRPVDNRYCVLSRCWYSRSVSRSYSVVIRVYVDAACPSSLAPRGERRTPTYCAMRTHRSIGVWAYASGGSPPRSPCKPLRCARFLGWDATRLSRTRLPPSCTTACAAARRARVEATNSQRRELCSAARKRVRHVAGCARAFRKLRFAVFLVEAAVGAERSSSGGSSSLVVPLSIPLAQV